MSNIKKGALNAVQCLRIKSRDRVVIITDKEKAHIASAVKKEASKFTKNILLLVIEEEIGKRPILSFPVSFQHKIKAFKPTVSYYIADGREGELPVFRSPLMKFLTQKLACRHGHMIGIDDQLMREGMSANYDEVYKTTMKVYKFVRGAKTIEVSALGTKLKAALSSKLRWKPCTGRIVKRGDWSNLPEGEVFTCPKSVNGVITAYVIGDFFSKKYGVLKKPLVIEIKNSRIVSVKSRFTRLEKEFTDYVGANKNGNRVGEFAIGTLIGLKRFTVL